MREEITCPTCYGEGYDVTATCDECNGSGFGSDIDNPTAQCDECWGDGEKEYDICPQCGGDGHIFKEDDFD